jgi:hypothetical protein
MAHTHNPSYSGGRDLQDLSQKNPSQKKKPGEMAQGVGPEFKSQ